MFTVETVYPCIMQQRNLTQIGRTYIEIAYIQQTVQTFYILCSVMYGVECDKNF